MSNYTSLKNHFLIAMPNLADVNFAQAVTYICEHSEKGAMGIVINYPLTIHLGDILKDLNIHADNQETAKIPIFGGGPIQQDRGFVLHTPDKQKWESTFELSDKLSVTTSKDILEAIANNRGPKKSIIALGYAGWGEGQLEKEIAQNSWISCPANNEILFNTPSQEIWHAAAKLMGVNLKKMSFDVGHA